MGELVFVNLVTKRMMVEDERSYEANKESEWTKNGVVQVRGKKRQRMWCFKRYGKADIADTSDELKKDARPVQLGFPVPWSGSSRMFGAWPPLTCVAARNTTSPTNGQASGACAQAKLAGSAALLWWLGRDEVSVLHWLRLQCPFPWRITLRARGLLFRERCHMKLRNGRIMRHPLPVVFPADINNGAVSITTMRSSGRHRFDSLPDGRMLLRR
jgi:hypothetical protein